MLSGREVRCTSIVHSPREPALADGVEKNAVAAEFLDGVLFLFVNLFLHSGFAGEANFQIPFILNPLLFAPPFTRGAPWAGSFAHFCAPALQKYFRGLAFAGVHMDRQRRAKYAKTH